MIRPVHLRRTFQCEDTFAFGISGCKFRMGQKLVNYATQVKQYELHKPQKRGMEVQGDYSHCS